jgi:hypothetical protein
MEADLSVTYLISNIGVVTHEGDGYHDCAGLYYENPFDEPCPPGTTL